MTPQVLMRSLGHLLVAAAYAGLLLLTWAGLLRPLDNGLRDLRFAATPRTATGSVVFVDIDSQSLSSVGVWPWPRHVHADLLDAVMASGANDVAFDIDFSVASSPAEDAAFAAALERAGGYAYLAAFRQQKVGARAADFNLPLAEFRAFANPITVNVSLDPDGVVRSYPFGLTIGSQNVPSVASAFTGVSAPPGTAFNVDYSINPNAIERISAADLLAGKVAPERLAGKNVIVGASAVELRDYFVVPRFGAIPGALLQALATETLKQGRSLQPADPGAGLAAILLIGIIALLARRRVSVPVAIAGALLLSGAAEGLALWLQGSMGLLVDTAGVHLAAFALLLAVFAAELVRRGEQRRKATRERDAVRRILDQVVTDNFDGVVIADADDRIVAASQFAEQLLGRQLQGERAGTALPERFAQLLSGALQGHGEQGEFTLRLGESDGVLEYVVTHSTVEVGDAVRPVACLTFRDITARRRAEERLRYLGGHDPLTGAVSRTLLVETIEAAFEDGRDVGLVLVDLRRFRIINDALGHSQGDLLLKQVVSRLKSMGPDVVARLGGDSFALLTPSMTPEKLTGFGHAVVQWLAFPYQLADDHQAIIAASAGATNSIVSGRDAKALLSHADMALSAAKQRSGASVALFSPEMDNRLRQRQAMDASLRQALVRREFSLAYQPQVDLADGETVGAEALARWVHPTLGAIPPDRFIPAAEETGLIVEIGRWALEAACTEAARWPAPLKVAVNVSPVQFELSDVCADVRAALDRSGLAPERLELEITEGVFVHNFEAVTAKLREIRRLGVGVALDDFGTGYSSLSYLGQLPIDKIKIDQSFVSRLPADTEAAAIVRAVVTLAESLGKQVIAEGIETADQSWILQMTGCTLGQGYYFGRPLEPRAFASRIETARTALAAIA
jgi:diguanylate cyclase (GGDEF)-like protein